MEVYPAQSVENHRIGRNSAHWLAYPKAAAELKLTLPEATKQPQASATAVVDWEQGEKEPRGLNGGNIIRFLRYDLFF